MNTKLKFNWFFHKFIQHAEFRFRDKVGALKNLCTAKLNGPANNLVGFVQNFN